MPGSISYRLSGMTTNSLTLKLIFIPVLLLGALSAFVHPFSAVKRQTSSQALLVGAQIDAHTLFERSRQSCHSGRTVWPWYSYVPPVSWLIERDVRLARRHMNLSRWDEYTTEQRQAYLGVIAAAVRNRQMPPRRFTLIHPEALLSVAEQEQIYKWARGERRRLRTSKKQAPPIAQTR